MPEKPAGEKSEQPTAERLRKSRQQGQIPESQEVPSVLMLSTLLVVFSLTGMSLLNWACDELRDGLGTVPDQPLTSQGVLEILQNKAWSMLGALFPFLLGAGIMSVLSSGVTSGFSLCPKAIGLKMDRISPANGMKNLFSSKNLVRVLVGLGKLAVVVLIVYRYLADKMGELLTLRWASPAGTVAVIAQTAFGVLLRVSIGLGAIALFDFLYQRWKYRKDQMMTRQEVKEERKQYEVAPELKGRIRALQMEMARKRMLQEVPNADVVVTNPDHVAVALKYDPLKANAPYVLAKGPDHLCEQIKKIARAHDVPIVRRPPLARALFAACEIGQVIPESLFLAVAEILAMIFRLRKKSASAAV